LRVSAYGCCYQINRCILSPSGTLLTRNCTQSWLNHHVALMLGRLILCPPQLLPEDPPQARLHPPQTKLLRLQQVAAKTATPAICGRMEQLVEAIWRETSSLSICTLSQQRSIVIIVLSVSCCGGLERNTRVFVVLVCVLFSTTVNFLFSCLHRASVTNTLLSNQCTIYNM